MKTVEEVDLETADQELITAVKCHLPLTPALAAAYLHLAKSTVYRLACEKKIKCYKPNGCTVFFKIEDLDAYAYRNPVMASFEVVEKAEEILNA